MPIRVDIAKKWQTLFVLVCLAIIAGCAGFQKQSKPAAVPEIHPGILAGYLQPDELPNSLSLLPPPPAEDTAARALDEEKQLMKDGSYPSGHTALGWAWALILTEIAPDRADAILARGRAFGESRNVCNVHWHSDVVEGRFMGAAAVARLHADPAFRNEVEAAKDEYRAARAKGLQPSRDCRAEAEGLAFR